MSLTVLEIRRRDYGALSARSARMIGGLLTAEDDIVAVWISSDSDQALRNVPRLQVALEAPEMIQPIVIRLSKQHRLPIAAFALGGKSPYVVPNEVSEMLGIGNLPNDSVAIAILKRPDEGT